MTKTGCEVTNCDDALLWIISVADVMYNYGVRVWGHNTYVMMLVFEILIWVLLQMWCIAMVCSCEVTNCDDALLCCLIVANVMYSYGVKVWCHNLMLVCEVSILVLLRMWCIAMVCSCEDMIWDDAHLWSLSDAGVMYGVRVWNHNLWWCLFVKSQSGSCCVCDV